MAVVVTTHGAFFRKQTHPNDIQEYNIKTLKPLIGSYEQNDIRNTWWFLVTNYAGKLIFLIVGNWKLHIHLLLLFLALLPFLLL